MEGISLLKVPRHLSLTPLYSSSSHSGIPWGSTLSSSPLSLHPGFFREPGKFGGWKSGFQGRWGGAGWDLEKGWGNWNL